MPDHLALGLAQRHGAGDGGDDVLAVSAFDLHRKIWILDRQPVVRLA